MRKSPSLWSSREAFSGLVPATCSATASTNSARLGSRLSSREMRTFRVGVGVRRMRAQRAGRGGVRSGVGRARSSRRGAVG